MILLLNLCSSAATDNLEIGIYPSLSCVLFFLLPINMLITKKLLENAGIYVSEQYISRFYYRFL